MTEGSPYTKQKIRVTLLHMRGRISGKSGPLCVATKMRKFQKAPPPVAMSSFLSPISRTQRATLGQSNVNCWLKHVSRILSPRNDTCIKDGRQERCCRWRSLLLTLTEPRDPSPPLDMFLVTGALVWWGCGGFNACRTTVKAKLMSVWRTLGASVTNKRKHQNSERYTPIEESDTNLFFRIQHASTEEVIGSIGSIPFAPPSES